MRRLATVVAGRRTKWLVVLAWVVLLVVFAPLGQKLKDVTNDRIEDALPGKAEATRVVRLQKARFAGGETVTGVVVYERAGGLTAGDRAKIAADARRARALPLVGPPAVPFRPGSQAGLASRDGELAQMVVTVPANIDKLSDWGKELRDATGSGAGGLKVYVTGELGFDTDQERIFGSADTKLLLATVALVLVLLGLIYRSPVIALFPIVVVGIAYTVAQGLIYLYAKSGQTVDSTSTGILVVLMFGVGTDYCLLLVSRYREELRRLEDKHRAMARALRRAGPAIVASGATVIAAMLTLLLADIGSTRSLGPVMAIGVASVLLTSMTLLPAMLAIGGRRAFWPRRRLIAYRPDAVEEDREGLWRRTGAKVLRRPGLALVACLVVFGAGALGLLAYKEDYSVSGFFKTSTESVDGYNALQRAFPAGDLSPTTVLVRRSVGPVRPADVAAVQARLASLAQVASVRLGGLSRDRRIAQLDLVFVKDPFGPDALSQVAVIRGRLDDLGPGVDALVGSGTALQEDFNSASARDLRVVIPVALAVIAVILGLLLEAVVAPIFLIGTVVLSFFGTLGLSLVFFRYVVGDAGVSNGLPIFAFIFLVALGTDYTIFLMSRVREEARSHGTREGMLRALSATGPVITSAGIILAGTFSVLMTLPVTFAFDIGFMVAFGILLDTFVVRTIMVPAIVELLGDASWWPSSPTGGAHAVHEPTAVEEPARAPAAVGN